MSRNTNEDETTATIRQLVASRTSETADRDNPPADLAGADRVVEVGVDGTGDADKDTDNRHTVEVVACLCDDPDTPETPATVWYPGGRRVDEWWCRRCGGLGDYHISADESGRNGDEPEPEDSIEGQTDELITTTAHDRDGNRAEGWTGHQDERNHSGRRTATASVCTCIRSPETETVEYIRSYPGGATVREQLCRNCGEIKHYSLNVPLSVWSRDHLQSVAEWLAHLVRSGGRGEETPDGNIETNGAAVRWFDEKLHREFTNLHGDTPLPDWIEGPTRAAIVTTIVGGAVVLFTPFVVGVVTPTTRVSAAVYGFAFQYWYLLPILGVFLYRRYN